jgi:hypothetical protein
MRMAANHPDSWAVGFCEETWWSRLALPSLHSWSKKGEPLRLVEQSLEKDDLRVPKPSPATGSTCRSSMRCGCPLWMVAR